MHLPAAGLTLLSMISPDRGGSAKISISPAKGWIPNRVAEKFTSAAMAFCNEVASQWQCERVSIGFLKERYVQLKAMSHTESFNRKMQVVQDIESAMEECLDQALQQGRQIQAVDEAHLVFFSLDRL